MSCGCRQVVTKDNHIKRLQKNKNGLFIQFVMLSVFMVPLILFGITYSVTCISEADDMSVLIGWIGFSIILFCIGLWIYKLVSLIRSIVNYENKTFKKLITEIETSSCCQSKQGESECCEQK